ncbi:GntR family transcriptional regulator [Actinomadura scrupuli]|uniref:GntR family transcriptional regulator n=1 Tax=Actinomadura scrupuli TaxID=559629 RepID=UPI003D99E893
MPPRTIRRAAYAPAYVQLAQILRDRIKAGDYEPGSLLPSEPRLGQEYDLGRLTVRKAVAILRVEGLVVTERGVGNRVRERREEPNVVAIRAGDRVGVRLATRDDEEQWGIAEGTPVLVVTRKGERERVYRGDETVAEVDDQEAS